MKWLYAQTDRVGEQRARAIAVELKLQPDWSDNAIAKKLGVHNETVAAHRADFEANYGSIRNKDRTEANGRKARGRKPNSVVPDTEMAAKLAKIW